jgi:pyrroline-5-carboxylate reductase
MIQNLRIAVIGAGVMGEAIIGGLLKQQLVAPDQLVATELRAERRMEIEQRYGVRVTDDNVEAAHWAQVAIFSVKPQSLPKVLPELRGALAEASWCSRSSPARRSATSSTLDHRAIVRSMPNTPAQIGGRHDGVDGRRRRVDEQRGWARTILETARARAVRRRRELPLLCHRAQWHRAGLFFYCQRP